MCIARSSVQLANRSCMPTFRATVQIYSKHWAHLKYWSAAGFCCSTGCLGTLTWGMLVLLLLVWSLLRPMHLLLGKLLLLLLWLLLLHLLPGKLLWLWLWLWLWLLHCCKAHLLWGLQLLHVLSRRCFLHAQHNTQHTCVNPDQCRNCLPKLRVLCCAA